MSDKFSLAFKSEITAALSRGVKVYIRAAEKYKLPAFLQEIAIENPAIVHSIAVIDRMIIWNGLPVSTADFISEKRRLTTKYRPVIRFVGKRTATVLYGYLEQGKIVDSSMTGGKDISTSFGQYVALHKKCPSCGRQMKLKKGKSGFFIGCTGYPECKRTELPNADFVNEYLYQDRKNPMHCKHDKYTLEAKQGPYGVYVHCCSMNNHKYRLDEI